MSSRPYSGTPGGRIVEREVSASSGISVVTHRGDLIEGDVKTMTGSGSHADQLARMTGLVQARSLDGTARRVQDEGLLHHELPMSS